jgi:hypothetical protein
MKEQQLDFFSTLNDSDYTNSLDEINPELVDNAIREACKKKGGFVQKPPRVLNNNGIGFIL